MYELYEYLQQLFFLIDERNRNKLITTIFLSDDAFSNVFAALHEKLKHARRCSICQMYDCAYETDEKDFVCNYCKTASKDVLVIVEYPEDLYVVSSALDFMQPIFYVLYGALKLQTFHDKENQNIFKIIDIIEKYGVSEVVIAIPQTLEKRVVISKINQALSNLPVKVTRLNAGVLATSAVHKSDLYSLRESMINRVEIPKMR